jgi:3-dehydroquinate synthase
MSEFDLRHGEAVAIGVALDVRYAARAGYLDEGEAQRVVDCLHTLGFRLHHPAMNQPDELLGGLDEFREHLGGPLTISMPGGIGKGFDVHDVNRLMMRKAMNDLVHLAGAERSAPLAPLHCETSENAP